MRKFLFAILLVFALALFIGSVATLFTSNDVQTLTITGSSTVAPLAVELAKRFEEKNPGVRVDVQTGGSSRGISDVRKGLADIGMVSRALKENEADLNPWLIAQDGLSLITHADNPVKSLSNKQIIDIYVGKIDNWKQVGGKDAPITVVHKAEGRSTLELFLNHFNLSNKNVQADVIIGDNEQGIKTITGNPNAVGYVSIGVAEYGAAEGLPIQLIPLEGHPASIETVKDGTFPLARELNFVTAGPLREWPRRFLDFAQSPEVKDLVENQHFVPVQ